MGRPFVWPAETPKPDRIEHKTKRSGKVVWTQNADLSVRGSWTCSGCRGVDDDVREVEAWKHAQDCDGRR